MYRLGNVVTKLEIRYVNEIFLSVFHSKSWLFFRNNEHTHIFHENKV